MAFAKSRLQPPRKPYVSLFKRCNDCRFHILRDEGYSNYTVEGVSFNCAKGLHPKAPFDNFYAKAPELGFAESCTSFTRGEGVHIDVDKEELESLTPAQQEVLDIEKTVHLLNG
jgi:hypothetical protein